MFYPQAMTEIELIVPEKDLLAVTSTLAHQGVFHQADAGYLSSETGLHSADSWQEKAAVYAALEREILGTMQASNIEEGQPMPADEAEMIEIDVARPLVEQIDREVQKVTEQLAAEQKKVEQLEGYLHQLEPVASIELDISRLRDLHYMFSMLGVIPVGNVERLRTSLARIPFVLLTLRQDSRKAVVWLVGTQQNSDILARAARSAYLNPLDLPDVYQGTPSEIIEALHTGIERAEEYIAEHKAMMNQLNRTHQQQMQMLLWRVRVSRMLAEAMGRFGKLRYTYLVVGWAPSSKLVALTQQLKQASQNILIETFPSARQGNVNERVPVALHNPGITGIFQQLVTTYGRPRYDEMDPTWLMTLTFPLLFGAMFGDVGHGLVLALLGWLISSRKIPALRSLANLGAIIATCGLAGALFGVLYGSVFGLENVLPAIWIRPMQNIMSILIAAIGAGVALLSIGFLLNIFNAWTARDWGRLWFDHNGIAGFVFYWSLIGLAAGALISGFPIHPVVFAVPAVLAGLVTMFSEALKRLIEEHRLVVEGGFGTYAIQAFFELFETLISFLSNSLSYVRVGAFAVAHAGLSAMVFILADLVGPSRGMGYWVVVALGNLFVIGFEGLIVGIQTMRLEYYEFFSKFFTGGGRLYKPLTLLSRADK